MFNQKALGVLTALLMILLEREPLGEERSLDKAWVVMAAGKCEHLVVFGKVMEDGF